MSEVYWCLVADLEVGIVVPAAHQPVGVATAIVDSVGVVALVTWEHAVAVVGGNLDHRAVAAIVTEDMGDAVVVAAVAATVVKPWAHVKATPCLQVLGNQVGNFAVVALNGVALVILKVAELDTGTIVAIFQHEVAQAKLLASGFLKRLEQCQAVQRTQVAGTGVATHVHAVHAEVIPVAELQVQVIVIEPSRAEGGHAMLALGSYRELATPDGLHDRLNGCGEVADHAEHRHVLSRGGGRRRNSQLDLADELVLVSANATNDGC